jgi:hypothetical protein
MMDAALKLDLCVQFLMEKENSCDSSQLVDWTELQESINSVLKMVAPELQLMNGIMANCWSMILTLSLILEQRDFYRSCCEKLSKELEELKRKQQQQ